MNSRPATNLSVHDHSQKITVLVVDDSAAIRTMLRDILLRDDGLIIVAEAAAAEDALNLVARYQPTVVVLDVDLPATSGLRAIPAIARACRTAKILMFTANIESDVVDEAFAAGAAGFVAKHKSDALPEAIRSAAAGHTVLAV